MLEQCNDLASMGGDESCKIISIFQWEISASFPAGHMPKGPDYKVAYQYQYII
jgi:hypothetical protein